MQEVVKRMQERQQAAEPPKKIGPVNLAMVRADGEFYPIMFPSDVYLGTGDVVVFMVGTLKRGHVVFFESYCKEDDKIWALMTVTAGIAPVRAIEYYRKSICDWKEEK